MEADAGGRCVSSPACAAAAVAVGQRQTAVWTDMYEKRFEATQ